MILLDQILSQIAFINNHLDDHEARITTVEMKLSLPPLPPALPVDESSSTKLQSDDVELPAPHALEMPQPMLQTVLPVINPLSTEIQLALSLLLTMEMPASPPQTEIEQIEDADAFANDLGLDLGAMEVVNDKDQDAFLHEELLPVAGELCQVVHDHHIYFLGSTFFARGSVKAPELFISSTASVFTWDPGGRKDMGTRSDGSCIYTYAAMEEGHSKISQQGLSSSLVLVRH